MTRILDHAHDFNAVINVVTAQNYINNSPGQDILKDLEARICPEAIHDSSDRRDAPKCHPDTRVAIQEEIYSWVVHGDADPHPTRIKWVTGPAGSGKTAIAGSLADRFSKEGLLGASFFFWSLSPSPLQRTKTALIPTIAYQLAERHHLLGDEIASAIKRHPLVFTKTLRVQMETLILQPLRQVNGKINSSGVIIIDGLDECQAAQLNSESDIGTPQVENMRGRPMKENDQVEILRTLLEASSDSAFPFRIIIISRPERAIRATFYPSDEHGPVFSILTLDEKYHPDADIALFLNAKFNELRRKHNLGSSWPPAHAIPTLVENASGQFIYVATVLRFLVESRRTGNMHTLLETALRLKPEDSNSNPFAHLDALYSQILQSSPNPTLAVLWIWVINGNLPGDRFVGETSIHRGRVSAHFLNRWLQTYPGEADYLLGDLHSLVKVPPSSDTESQYHFYHKSLFDFLRTLGRSGSLFYNSMNRCKWFSAKYLEVCLNEGFTTEAPDAITDMHLSSYFDIRPCFVLYADPSDVPIQFPSYGVDWWVRQAFNKGNHERVMDLLEVVHFWCSSYLCHRKCRMWRKSIEKHCEAGLRISDNGESLFGPFPGPQVTLCAKRVLGSRPYIEAKKSTVQKIWQRIRG